MNYDSDKLMKVNDLGCVFNMPLAVATRKDSEGNETPVGLPPYSQIMPHMVDEYPGCPDNWMHGSSKASSYFIPVEEGKGMWLDFNHCLGNKHDVAVVISVQGINPISGQKQDKMSLEQYRDKCPVHNCDFQQDRFCPECKRTWPAQNYLATTGINGNTFWIDGFRNADGQVRQYIFSAEEMKGIAKQIIGNDRVFAIGIAFFLSKKPHGREPQNICRATSQVMDFSMPTMDIEHKYNPDLDFGNEQNDILEGGLLADDGVWGDHMGSTARYASLNITNSNADKNFTSSEIKMSKCISPQSAQKKVAEQKKLEVGAGGLIDQQVDFDPKDPDYWEDEPTGFIYLNYVTEEACDAILAAGTREEKKDGFMEGMNIGVSKENS